MENKELEKKRSSEVSLLDLFITFFRIGVFTFGGGYAMIPLIEREIIDKKSWLPKKEFIDLLTIAQSIPGPIALNTAVFIGFKNRGYKGALASLLGVVVPSFSILLLIAIYFANIRDNQIVDAAFKGMRPAVIALIISPVISLARELKPALIIVTVLTAIAIWYFELSPITMIALAAIVGLTWAHVAKQKLSK